MPKEARHLTLVVEANGEMPEHKLPTIGRCVGSCSWLTKWMGYVAVGVSVGVSKLYFS